MNEKVKYSLLLKDHLSRHLLISLQIINEAPVSPRSSENNKKYLNRGRTESTVNKISETFFDLHRQQQNLPMNSCCGQIEDRGVVRTAYLPHLATPASSPERSPDYVSNNGQKHTPMKNRLQIDTYRHEWLWFGVALQHPSVDPGGLDPDGSPTTWCNPAPSSSSAPSISPRGGRGYGGSDCGSEA
jgi:hypothetical protein